VLATGSAAQGDHGVVLQQDQHISDPFFLSGSDQAVLQLPGTFIGFSAQLKKEHDRGLSEVE
jgi:hypothetical protein